MSVSSTDKGLLTPDNCMVIFIGDPQQTSGEAVDWPRQRTFSSAWVLAQAASIFHVPAVLCGGAAPELMEMFPGAVLKRGTSMNVWDDRALVDAVKQSGRWNLVMAAWGNDVCVVMPALQALTDGYGVYVVADACGGLEWERTAAIRRLEQAGAVSMSAVQVLLEFQRDWAGEHAEEVKAVMKRFNNEVRHSKLPEDP